jgi:YspA, cpYpsA-related SLOG family
VRSESVDDVHENLYRLAVCARVLVCGDRNFKNANYVVQVLDFVHNIGNDIHYGIDTLIHGGASGVDSFAGSWADYTDECLVEVYPADWDKLGKAAGPIRNTKMLEEGKPDFCIAFPGGKGTLNMVNQCKKAGVPVFHAVEILKDVTYGKF